MFEFDEEKSKANKEKHGINFVEAQKLWLDDDGYVEPSAFVDEIRYTLTAKYDGKLWTCAYTSRGDNIRIISVRRARDNEKEKYNKR